MAELKFSSDLRWSGESLTGERVAIIDTCLNQFADLIAKS